jgi:hypothetical protein
LKRQVENRRRRERRRMKDIKEVGREMTVGGKTR